MSRDYLYFFQKHFKSLKRILTGPAREIDRDRAFF